MTSQKKCDCPFNVANCICQPEKDHGLQASAAKQRIDEQAAGAIKHDELRIDTFHAGEHSGFVHTCQTAVRITHLPTGVFVESKDERSQHRNKQRCMELLPAAIQAAKPVPPAVGEFAVHELADLRARLAKYEDAEGRPLQPAADLARRIDQAITAFTNGRASMHVPPQDTDVDIVLAECLKLANALESQALEIGRLTQHIDQQDDAYALLSLDAGRKMDGLERELAALKAQPTGVVLSERSLLSKAAAQIEYLAECLENVTEDDPEDGTAESLDEAREIAEQITARLNSTPVGAGDLSGAIEQLATIERSIDQRDARLAAMAGSAGVVDERAAFERAVLSEASRVAPELRRAGDEYKCATMQWAFELWQARAALTASAPSHGEQVREALAELLECPASVVQATVPRAGIDAAPPYQVVLDVSVSLTRWRKAQAALKAAAPSAGSQGGDS